MSQQDAEGGSQMPPPSQNTEPPEIKVLDEQVANKIAAGEVIQRPSSAIKELLENSIDAGATQINIIVKDGGLKLLQIQDNGHGIRKEDLSILCHRHTTSKLKAFEDLEAIGTLGFRGEALCSISFVSHMTVTTMTHNSEHGYKAVYRDGEMEPSCPRPCASTPGTTITVDDLFYNVSTRKNNFRNTKEEYARILDAVGRYAVFKHGVGFAVRQDGEAKVALHVSPNGNQLERIGAVYGSAVSNELVPVSLCVGQMPDGCGNAQGGLDSVAFKLEGCISGVNYAGKKSMFVVFINGRSVECGMLRRAIEAVYSSILPKNTKPFVFLKLELPPGHVDVNVHPTKREVGFLFQEELVQSITELVQETLLASNDTRTFTHRRLSASFMPDPSQGITTVKPSRKSSEGTQRDNAGGDHKLVRTDHQTLTLDAYVDHPNRSNALEAAGSLGTITRRRGITRFDRTEFNGGENVSGSEQGVKGKLDSQIQGHGDDSLVRNLLERVAEGVHEGLALVLKEHTFVGMVDETLAFIQHKTRLYLVNVTAVSYDLFYQQALRGFKQLNAVHVDPPVDVTRLCTCALDIMERLGKWDESKGPKHDIAKCLADIIVKHRDHLRGWFNIGISEDAKLECYPLLLEGYCPNMARLPEFVMRLGRDVEWDETEECVDSVARLIAEFYSVKEPVGKRKDDGKLCSNEWVIQHVVFRAFRGNVMPPEHRAKDGSIVQTACLENLYSVFERC